jgi:hypothetical protein
VSDVVLLLPFSLLWLSLLWSALLLLWSSTSLPLLILKVAVVAVVVIEGCWLSSLSLSLSLGLSVTLSSALSLALFYFIVIVVVVVDCRGHQLFTVLLLLLSRRSRSARCWVLGRSQVHSKM